MARSYSAANGGTATKIQDPGILGSITRFWQRSYAADYVGFALLLTGYIFLEMIAEPFHRMFSLDNLAIQFPFAEVERVPSIWNIVYAGGLPMTLLLLWALVFRPGVHKAHVSILGLLVSLIFASFLTNIIKNAVGRPRPDLIARCIPKKGTPEHALVTIEVCTQTNHHRLHDGWRSFPSGHSSFAFSGLGYLALYVDRPHSRPIWYTNDLRFLAGQMHVFRPRTDLARVLLALAPFIGAALIAISRCEDYRHDVYDVTVGSLLGLLVAYFSYRRYYPSLKSHGCDTPYPSRADTALERGYGRRKDEEELVTSPRGFETDDMEDDSDHVPLTEPRG